MFSDGIPLALRGGASPIRNHLEAKEGFDAKKILDQGTHGSCSAE
jgi:hypothetical protein